MIASLSDFYKKKQYQVSLRYIDPAGGGGYSGGGGGGKGSAQLPQPGRSILLLTCCQPTADLLILIRFYLVLIDFD